MPLEPKPRSRCIYWHWINHPPPCRHYACPAHGFPIRRRRAAHHAATLCPDDFFATNVLHLNSRLHGAALGPLAKSILTSFRQFFPHGRLSLFPHVTQESPQLLPLTHLHAFYSSPISISTRKMREWEEMVIGLKPVMLCSEAKWRDALEVTEAIPFLYYLYQATEAHRYLGVDRLPARGLHFQQVYGRPRFTRSTPAVSRPLDGPRRLPEPPGRPGGPRRTGSIPG